MNVRVPAHGRAPGIRYHRVVTEGPAELTRAPVTKLQIGSARTRVGFIGAGIMARHHLEEILDGTSQTEVVAICEPSAAAYAAAAQLFDQHGLPVPPNEPDWTRFVARYSGQLDAAFIITPHVLHFAQATACLEAGFDVLLEKPMVMTADEARALIETRDRTGRLLVVAFQGSLSPQVREAARMLRSGVRAARTVNPSPPEVGLRMARLWDAIRESTDRGGAVISLPPAATRGAPDVAEAVGQ